MQKISGARTISSRFVSSCYGRQRLLKRNLWINQFIRSSTERKLLTERASRDEPKKWVGVTRSKSKETAKACELMVRECPATLILQKYKTHINREILRHIPHQNLGKMTMFATFFQHILTHEHEKLSQNLRLLHPHTSHHFTLSQLHAPYYTVICGLSGSTIFFTLSHKRHLQKIQDLGLYVFKAWRSWKHEGEQPV